MKTLFVLVGQASQHKIASRRIASHGGIGVLLSCFALIAVIVIVKANKWGDPLDMKAQAGINDPTWTLICSSTSARSGHTATLLANGKVLITGGLPNSTSAELYDPVVRLWSKTSSPSYPRSQHAATLLPNGKVLVVSGFTAELFNPAANVWEATSNPTIERYQHTATLLPNGKVLVVGGYNGSYLRSVVLYDPVTSSWSATGNLITARASHTATLLPSGKVLVVGGYTSNSVSQTAETYDPASGVWSTTSSLTLARAYHTATLMPNGKVLVVGGYDGHGGDLSITELYDPSNGMWSIAASVRARSFHTATLLSNGKVIVAGGGPLGSVEADLYDPTSGMWSATTNLNKPRRSHTATLLPNGNILAAGGDTSPNHAELYEVSVTPPQVADLRLMASATPEPVMVGDSITYTLTVTNLGPSGASAVSLSGNLSGDVSIDSAYPGCFKSGTAFNCNMGDFATCVTKNVYVIAKPTKNGVIGLTASVAGNEPDSVLTNNTVAQNITVLPYPTPGIVRVDPDWVTTGKGAFALSVIGTNFVNGAVVRWNRGDRPTTYMSNTRLTASIAASDTSITGTARVTVFNPPPGGGTSNAISLLITNTLANVSAASYSRGALAPESIVAAFGNDLAIRAQVATTTPLPTSMAGTTVSVKDNTGTERLASLFFVSPTQVNYQIPPGTSPGSCFVKITSGNGSLAGGEIDLQLISPGLFSANGNGQGVAAGLVLRLRADNSQTYEPIARYDSSQRRFFATPIDLGPPTDQVFLILYGTGIRNVSSLGAVSVEVGGLPMQVLYAGKQGSLVGLDQVNLRLSRTLIGRGSVNVVLTCDRVHTNPVQITLK